MKKIASAIALSFAVTQVSFAQDDSLKLFREGKYEAAKSGLIKLANQKNKNALYYYGLLKLHGYTVKKNVPEAISLIKEAANKNNRSAQLFLARYYFNITKESDKAFFWFKKAADRGSLTAQIFVAAAYHQGFGTKKNAHLERRYIIKAAKKDDPFAQYQLGKHYIKSRSYRSHKLGIAWLKKSAKQEYAPAYYELLLENQGSYRKKQYYLNKLKNLDTAESAYYLGKFYLSYDNRDIKFEGVKWLKLSKQKRYLPAIFELGIVYQSGSTNLYDDKKSFDYISFAADKGYQPAQKQLSLMYKEGIGTNKNLKLATQWMNKYKAITYQEKKDNILNWIGLFDNPKLESQFSYRGILTDWQDKKHIQPGVVNQSPKMATINKTDIFKPKLTLTHPEKIKSYILADNINLHSKTNKEDLSFPYYPVLSKNISQQEIKKIYSAALLGDRDAQFLIGQLYEKGIGVEKNNNVAAQWFFTAAKQNHLPAEYNLGMLFLEGRGVNQDLEKAHFWLNKTAFKGNVEAQYALGIIYQYGYQSSDRTQQIQPDFKQAIGMYHLASGAGNNLAKYQLANLYSDIPLKKFVSEHEKQKRYQTIKSLYEEAYHSGIKQAELPLAYYYMGEDSTANKQSWSYEIINKAYHSTNSNKAQLSLLLAIMNERGIGTIKNLEQAISFYKKASEYNIPAAKFALGSYYYLGKGVPQDKDQAKTLLSEAALNGIPSAYYNLAVIKKDNGLEHQSELYEAARNGYSRANLYLADHLLASSKNPADLKNAAYIYQQLADKGHEQAELKLGYMYHHGIYFNQNYKLAKKYYQRSANKNNPTAQYQLGQLHQKGLLGYPKPNSAIYWYKRAAKLDYVPAMVGLGFLSESHRNNFRAAKDWYTEAAGKNNAIAKYNLALILDYGKGISPNDFKARELYKEAARANILPAKINLANFLSEQTNDNNMLAESVYWYQQATKDNHPSSHYKLAKMYESGVGTGINLEKAKHHYQQAAKLGYPDAYVSLARIHEASNQEEQHALEHYKKAAALGNTYANFKVARYMIFDSNNERAYKQGIQQLQALAKKGYAPAKVVLTQLQTIKKAKLAHQQAHDKLVKQAKKDGMEPPPLTTLKIDIPEPSEVIKITKSKIKEYNSPSLMYLDAIHALENGNIYQSKQVLNEIVTKYPNYQPAQKTYQQLQTQESAIHKL